MDNIGKFRGPGSSKQKIFSLAKASHGSHVLEFLQLAHLGPSVKYAHFIDYIATHFIYRIYMCNIFQTSPSSEFPL